MSDSDISTCEVYTMSGINIHYIAGFVDGEGCIFLNARRNGERADTYVGLVGITNTNLAVLEAINEYFEHTGRIQKHTVYSNKHTQTYQLNFLGKNCIRVLRELLPYLQVKRRQAELMLEYYGEREDGRTHKGASVEQQAWRESMKQQISALNAPHWTRNAVSH
jgi:hypothetical protein